jgi:DNA-binding NtrC family response regulator
MNRKSTRQAVVLIVEDDMDLCHILEHLVVKRCKVFVDHTIKDAKSHLLAIMPDIVLLDNNLPDGLGISTIATIHELCPGAKIILMTADTTKGLQEEAIRLGAYNFIAKPFNLAQIKEIISTLFPENRAA